MRPKNVFKILLDIAMIPLFISLLFYSALGAQFHEIAGLAMLALTILHIALNIKWTAASVKNFDKLKGSIKAQLILDEIMIFSMLLLGITGIAISTVVFPAAVTFLTAALTTAHTVLTWTTGILLLAHIGLHIPYMGRSLLRLGHSFKKRGVWQTCIGFAAGVFAVAMLYGEIEAAFTATPSTDFQTDINISRQIDDDDEAALPAPTQQSAATPSDDSSYEAPSDESNDSYIEETPAAETPSLSEFLGKLVCTGCGRRCSLLSPRCGKGEQQAAQATQQYQEEYGDQ